MQNLLMEIHESRNILMSQKETRFQTLVLEAYLLHYDSIIRQSMAENLIPQKPKGKQGRTGKGKVLCLLERLRDYKGGVLRFAADWAVPFTNNEAERTIRFSKVKQKVSGCFRTEKRSRGLYADHELCQYGQETRNVLFRSSTGCTGWQCADICCSVGMKSFPFSNDGKVIHSSKIRYFAGHRKICILAKSSPL